MNHNALFRIAQEVTDKVLGKGAYKKLNRFDPSKGETQTSAFGDHKPKTKRKTRRTL